VEEEHRILVEAEEVVAQAQNMMTGWRRLWRRFGQTVPGEELLVDRCRLCYST